MWHGLSLGVTGMMVSLWHLIKNLFRLIVKLAFGLVATIVLLVVLGDGTILDRSLRVRVTAIARDELFDYVAWEVDALWDKADQELFGVQSYLPEDDRSAQVIDYLARLNAAQALDAEIERVYTDPAVRDPQAASADLRAERDALRRQLAQDQPLVESIIEEQVSAVLVDEGFAVLGQVMPPVSMHFSEVPVLLVISPRDHIEFAVDLNLDALSVEDRAALEDQIEGELDVSALIVPLGGISLYPSMIVEPSYRDVPDKVARAFEVTAHEWSHHYLVFYPLGWDYSENPETRIINETTATFFGREIAQKIMARYYPDLTPPQYPSFLNPPDVPATPATQSAPSPDPDAPPPFDYAATMDETRTHVDGLLAQGRVEEAEAYMESQRQLFVANGYAIRKLNQAYFAFYGGYQGSPGAGGADPIGPAIEELRALSPDLVTWLKRMGDITTREELLAALEAAHG
jgi:hypothetical protein